MMLSNKALKFDHETAQAAIKEILCGTDAAPSHKLAALYGARFAMIHGGIPEFLLPVLDAEIAYWERQRDFDSEQAEKIGNASEETADCSL